MNAAATAAELFPAAEPTGVTSADRPKWLAMRRTMLTASKTAALFGKHPFTTPLDLYVDMVMGRPEEIITIDDPRFWGTVFEAPILEAASAYYGWKMLPGGQLLRSRKHPGLGATLDGVVDLGGGWFVYEGKTTSAWRARDWDQETGKHPDHVALQAQHQTFVTGSDHAIVFCVIGGQKPVKVEVEANKEYHDLLVEESERFLKRVRELDPPDPTGLPIDAKALQRLYPVETGSVVALPSEAKEWTERYQEISEEVSQLKRRQAYYAQLLQNAIGSATYGVLPEPVGGKSCWRWATEPNGRRLRALKNSPPGASQYSSLRTANDTLVEQLRASVGETEPEPTGPVAPIRFGNRRRSRR